MKLEAAVAAFAAEDLALQVADGTSKTVDWASDAVVWTSDAVPLAAEVGVAASQGRGREFKPVDEKLRAVLRTSAPEDAEPQAKVVASDAQVSPKSAGISSTVPWKSAGW